MFGKDNRYLSTSGCSLCIQYEQQISILQDKLMETHNKLIDQLDVCRQQEATIIELTKKIIDLEAAHPQNSFQEQSFGIINNKINLFQNEKNNNNKMTRNYVQFTLNNSQQPSQYNSPTFVQNRTQLLQTDLQAMRLKVLQEITQKNSLKQELRDLKNKYKKQIICYQGQIKQLENNHEHLLRQYEYISKNLQVFKTKGLVQQKDKKNFNSTQIIQLQQKCREYQRLYKLEVNLNQSQNIKFSELKSIYLTQKQKVNNLQKLLQKYTTSSKCNTSAQCQRQYTQENCITIRKTPGKLRQKSNQKQANKTQTQKNQLQIQNLSSKISSCKFTSNKQNILRDATNICKPKQNNAYIKGKKQERQKKQDYQSTKQLIRKLEQAQNLTRKRKKSQILGSS